MLKDFKPSILFLTKFLVLYLGLNFGYSLYINSYGDNPDPFTSWVTDHCAAVLGVFGTDTDTVENDEKRNVGIIYRGNAIISVFEGCNGLNVMIIFFAFIVSFTHPNKKMLWFLPLGFLIIHMTNLMRVSFLFFVSKDFPDYMYFAHKYFFTAIIYVVVFILWFIWLTKVNVSRGKEFTES